MLNTSYSWPFVHHFGLFSRGQGLVISSKEAGKIFFLQNYCMCMHILLVFVSVKCRGQKRELDPLELELQTVISYPVSDEN